MCSAAAAPAVASLILRQLLSDASGHEDLSQNASPCDDDAADVAVCVCVGRAMQRYVRPSACLSVCLSQYLSLELRLRPWA